MGGWYNGVLKKYSENQYFNCVLEPLDPCSLYKSRVGALTPTTHGYRITSAHKGRKPASFQTTEILVWHMCKTLNTQFLKHQDMCIIAHLPGRGGGVSLHS